MHVSVEATGDIARRMTVAVPSARFEQEFSERLKRLAKSAKLPGFRPGKVPMKLLEAQYGEKLKLEVANDLIQASFYEAVGEKGLRPAGGPRIEPRSMDRGRDLEYVAEFEVFPRIARMDIRGMRIERPACQIEAEDVERTLEIMRRQRTTWNPVERPARENDRLVVDFEGRIDGQPFEGGSARGFPIVLGSRHLIDGFEQGLLGAHAGDSRTLDLCYPADYGNSAIAGRNVRFEVRVQQVAEPVLPAIDGEFARQFGIADGSVEALRAEVRANLERELKDRVRAVLREQVFKALLESNPMEIPKAMEQLECQRLMDRQRSTLVAQGIPPERVRLPSDPSAFAPEARRRAALGLILVELAKARGITPDPAAVRSRLEHLAESYESPQEFIGWHYAQPGRLADVESAVVEDKAVELLLQDAEVAEKPVSFKDLMQPG